MCSWGPARSRLLENLDNRLEQPELVQALSVLDLNDVPSDMFTLHGMDGMSVLAEHFEIDADTLLDEWTRFKTVVLKGDSDDCVRLASRDESTLSTPALCQFLCSNDTFSTVYSNLHKLYGIATTLPVSTAEVERLFSAMKLVYTDHRASLQVTKVNKLLMVKLNAPDPDEFPFRRWYASKNRRI